MFQLSNKRRERLSAGDGNANSGFHSIQIEELPERRGRSRSRAASARRRARSCRPRRHLRRAVGTSSASSPRGERRVRQRPWRRTSSLSRSVIVAARSATSGESMRRGPLDVDRVLLDDPTRPARQQHHPVAEAHRLAHVVGHEEHREAGLAPEPLELVVQHVAGHGVERAERLVHEQDVGLLRERARERDALAHAAGELVRALVAEGAEVHEVEELVGLGPALAPSATLRELQRELDVAARGEPREQRRLPGTSAWCARRRRRRCRALGRSSPAMRLSSVLLPQPDAPSRQTNSPVATSRVTLSSAWSASPGVP